MVKRGAKVYYFDLSDQHKPFSIELEDYCHLHLGLLTWILRLV